MEPGFQDIRKKEDFQDGEKDEELDKDYYPKLFTDGHACESIIVKIKDSRENGTMQ
jgi:hypothetical protein